MEFEIECNYCDAYNELGHCGAYSSCYLKDIYYLLNNILFNDVDYFLNYLKFQDEILPLIYEEEDLFWDDYVAELEADYWIN